MLDAFASIDWQMPRPAHASRALKLAEAGLLHLVQRRHGFEDFAYVAVARPKPRRNASAPHALPLKDAA